MTEIMTRDGQDIQGNPYKEHTIELDKGHICFCAMPGGHEDDHGYTLFTVKIEESLVTAEVSFGMDRETVRAFAQRLLDATL